MIDGHSILAFPNSPIPQENLSSKSLSQLSDPFELSEADFDNFDSLDSVVRSDGLPSPEPFGLNMSHRRDQIQTAYCDRLASFSTCRYCAAYL
jgi:hypothetical protein